jgi:hypothetical protein
MRRLVMLTLLLWPAVAAAEDGRFPPKVERGLRHALTAAVIAATPPAEAAEAAAMFTDGPLTRLMNIRTRTDENGYLRISAGTAGIADGPLTAMANLRGRTDENGYLRVACTGCGGGLTVGTTTITGGATTQVLFNDAGVLGSDAGFTYNKTTDTVAGLARVNVGGLNIGISTGTIQPTAGSIVFNLDNGTVGWSINTSGQLIAGAGGTAVISPTYRGSGTGVSVANVGADSCGTTAATIAGNQVSGKITVGATAGTQCRVTFSTAAPVSRDCTVTDETTTIATRATFVSTTTHDFFGAFVAGDLITYICTVR